ncbi:MAG: cache domain-containing protein [Bacillota bacterium]|nr:cache domain-containing protein [Bacillota bacterium]
MAIRSRSIKARYLFSGLAICLVSLLFVSVISYLVSYNITAQQSNLRIQEAALKNAAELDSWFMKYGNIVNGIVEDIEITGDYQSSHLFDLLKGKLDIYNKEVLDFYMGFEDRSIKLVSGSNWAPPDDYDCHTRDWYKAAVKNKGVIYTEPYVDAQTGKMVITIAEAVNYKGKFLGVMAADIYITNVIKTVNSYKINDTSYSFLIDNEGYFLTHPDTEFLPDKNGMKNIDSIKGVDYSKLSKALKENKMEIIGMKDYDGTSKYFILSKIKSPGWVFGISIHQSEYKKPLNNLLYGFVIALLISMIAGISIMLRIINGMVNPIKSLNDTVKSFSADNMDVRSEVNSSDELGDLGRSFNQMADTIQEYSVSLEKKVADRTKELQEKNDNIMESIDYAERLQRSILPPLPQRLSLSSDKCFVVYKPRDVVGGDMYWCKGNENKTMLAVADCTGHGVPGALMTMALNSIMDGLALHIDDKKPSEILQIVNLTLKETLGQNRKDSIANDGADMALCMIDRVNGKILFAGAKLSVYIGLNGEITEYKGSRHSVGYTWQKEAIYEDHEMDLVKGSVVYITTDGLPDQNMIEGKGGMGKSGFKNLLGSLWGKPIKEQHAALEELISEMLSNVEQRDDITVIGFEL